MACRNCWFAIALACLCSPSAWAQFGTGSWAGNSQAYRPRLFTERTWYTYPVNCPSMSDRISWYGVGASLSGTSYYDSVIRSPYGLDASRRLIQAPMSNGISLDRSWPGDGQFAR